MTRTARKMGSHYAERAALAYVEAAAAWLSIEPALVEQVRALTSDGFPSSAYEAPLVLGISEVRARIALEAS